MIAATTATNDTTTRKTCPMLSILTVSSSRPTPRMTLTTGPGA